MAIAAGVLQKDNQSGRVFVQLKLYNLQAKQIKAASVKIYPQDTIGQPLGEPLEYQYLDLSVQRDDNFGSQTPVMMPEAKTRAFAVSVQEVIFADNSVWQAAPEAAKVCQKTKNRLRRDLSHQKRKGAVTQANLGGNEKYLRQGRSRRVQGVPS